MPDDQSLGWTVDVLGPLPQPRSEPPVRQPRMTLEIFNDVDRVGTLTVGYHKDDVGACWWWEVGNCHGQLLDSGDTLETAGSPTPREAMRVLLMFLLSTTGPFNDTAAEWSTMHDTALAKALKQL